jgi:hypothetical protein
MARTDIDDEQFSSYGLWQPFLEYERQVEESKSSSFGVKAKPHAWGRDIRRIIYSFALTAYAYNKTLDGKNSHISPSLITAELSIPSATSTANDRRIMNLGGVMRECLKPVVEEIIQSGTKAKDISKVVETYISCNPKEITTRLRQIPDWRLGTNRDHNSIELALGLSATSENAQVPSRSRLIEFTVLSVIDDIFTMKSYPEVRD